MKNFHFKAILLCICLFASINAFAYDAKINGIYYNFISENEAEVTYQEYNGGFIRSDYSGNVTIPKYFNYNSKTYSVTTIGDVAFKNCSALTSITIGSGVTSIGYEAFYGCSKLTSITIPNSVKSIGELVLYGCDGLASIKVGAGNTTYDSRNNCNAIIKTATNTLITGCRTTTIPNGVTRIDEMAFYGCSRLPSITIPNSVKSFGNWAFDGCSGLTSITIPNSVTSIGLGAFYDCTKLTSVKVGWGTPITIEQNTFSNRKNATLYVPSGSKNNYIIAGFWKEFKEIKEYPAEVSNIYYSLNIESKTAMVVSSPDEEKYKGDVIIPEVITYLDETFTVTSIGEGAFANCTGVTAVTIPNSVTSIGSRVFLGCSNLTSVTISNNVTSISDHTFYGCSNLTSVTIPNSVTEIGSYAFYECRCLTSISIPNSVTSIGEIAFEGCNSLTSITIPNSVTTIGWGAFSGCISLTSVTLPNNITNIGYGTFDGCISLASITIPQSVISIGDYAFYYCSSLTSITLGNSVTNIGKEAFPKTSVFIASVCESLFTLWNNGYTNIKETETGRDLSAPEFSLVTSSASSLKLSFINKYPELTEKVTVSGSPIEKGTNGYEILLTGLEPDNLYKELASVTLSFEDASYAKSYSFRTEPLTLTTQQPKVINVGNVIVSAESNLNDAETNVGFEWRRTDWTDEFASNTGTAYLYEGKMEGYIRNLYTEKLWKYRPYYESDSGNRYYGEWVGIDPTNTSYFEPTVHTYAQINVTGNKAEVRGYAMRGTDNVLSQGFMYWPSSAPVSLRKRATSVPSGAIVVNASGHIMTATLEDLEYETTYKYVAFVTTSEGETFYGEMQTFSTSVDPDGIEEVKAAEDATEIARYDIQGRMIAKPQKGINIIRYSDGTTRKVLVK